MMQIGKKYLSTTSNTPFIFLGFTQGGMGRFIKDDQALFELLGEMFSQDALQRYADKHDLDKVGLPCTVIESAVDTSVWLSEEALNAAIDEHNAALAQAHSRLNTLRTLPAYAVDTLRVRFVREFKAQCDTAKVDISPFTFHELPAPEDYLWVCNNDRALHEEDTDDPACRIFCVLKRQPAYANLRAGYALFTGAPQMKMPPA